MKLMSWEIALLSYYIKQSQNVRKSLLQNAVNNPQVSGPLIDAYRKIDEIL